MVAFGNTRIINRIDKKKKVRKDSILVAVVDSFVERTFDHHNYYFDKPIGVDIAWAVVDNHLASADRCSSYLLLMEEPMVPQDIEEYILPLEDLLVVFDRLLHKVLGLVRHTCLFLKLKQTNIS
jgi:hypothetical protein